MDELRSLDWAKVLQAIGPAIVALASLIRMYRGTNRIHGALATEAEILSNLPKDSKLYNSMAQIVQRRIDELERAHNAKRDWPMLVVALIVAPGLTYLTIWLAQQGTWWGWLSAVPAGTLGLVFIYGIFETSAQVPRDNNGKRIPAGGEDS